MCQFIERRVLRHHTLFSLSKNPLDRTEIGEASRVQRACTRNAVVVAESVAQLGSAFPVPNTDPAS
jgi:hypothetical protein